MPDAESPGERLDRPLARLRSAFRQIHDGPNPQVGVRGIVYLDGFDDKLPFVVRVNTENRLHLNFELDEHIAARFRPAFERLTHLSAA